MFLGEQQHNGDTTGTVLVMFLGEHRGFPTGRPRPLS